MNQAVAERTETGVAEAPQGTTTQDLMRLALQQGAGIEQMRELMQMQREHEAHEARKAFVKAMAAFKADPPKVRKTKTVEFSGTRYSHATLADVCDAAIAKMSEYGLSHDWKIEQGDTGITVHCVITHDAGHSERTSMTAPADDSGKKNRIQQIASTTTYLERYTLMAALGMAARDMDDDGAAAGHDPEVSANQLDKLKKLAEAAKADVPKFLEYMSGVCGKELKELEDIPASKFETARGALQQKVDAVKRAASKHTNETKPAAETEESPE